MSLDAQRLQLQRGWSTSPTKKLCPGHPERLSNHFANPCQRDSHVLPDGVQILSETRERRLIQASYSNTGDVVLRLSFRGVAERELLVEAECVIWGLDQ